MRLGFPDLRKGCHFRRRESIAHAVCWQATIISGVAQRHTFIRVANADALTPQLRGIIAHAAIAHLHIPHSTRQRDLEPVATSPGQFIAAKSDITIELRKKRPSGASRITTTRYATADALTSAA